MNSGNLFETAQSSAARRSSGVPLAEKFFWIAGAGLLFFCNYYFQETFNTAYRIFLVLTAMTSVLAWRFTSVVISRYTIWIVLSLTIIGLMALAGWGDRIYRTLYLFARSIPLFFLGFSISRSRAGRRLVLVALVTGFTIVSVKDLYILIHSLGEAFTREEMAMMLESSDSVEAFDQIQNYIYHFPSLGFVCLIGSSLLDDRSRWVRFGCITSLVLLSLTILVSTWMAALMVLLIGSSVLVSIVLRNRRISWTYRFLYPVGLGIFMLLLIVLVGKYEAGMVQDSAKIPLRLRMIAQLFVEGGGFWEGLDALTGTRISLGNYSAAGFFKSPLVGVGDYTFSNWIGGHSFWLDSFARYGLIGGIPLAGMILSWSHMACWNFRRSGRTHTDCALLSIFITFPLVSLLNPYLFMATLDFIIFLAAGVVAGLNYQIRRRHLQNLHGAAPGSRLFSRSKWIY